MTRRHVTFTCEGETLVGTLDDAPGDPACSWSAAATDRAGRFLAGSPQPAVGADSRRRASSRCSRYDRRGIGRQHRREREPFPRQQRRHRRRAGGFARPSARDSPASSVLGNCDGGERADAQCRRWLRLRHSSCGPSVDHRARLRRPAPRRHPHPPLRGEAQEPEGGWSASATGKVSLRQAHRRLKVRSARPRRRRRWRRRCGPGWRVSTARPAC